MMGLPFEGEDTLAQEGASPSSLGASPMVRQPQPRSSPMDEALQRYVGDRTSSSTAGRIGNKILYGDPEGQIIKATQGAESHTAAIEQERAKTNVLRGQVTAGLLKTMKDSQDFLDSLPDDVRGKFADILAKPLAGLGRLAAGPDHPDSSYFTEDVAKHILTTPGGGRTFAETQPFIKKDQHRALAKEYQKDPKAGLALSQAFKTQNLQPYLQQFEANLGPAAEAVRQSLGLAPGSVVTLDQFKKAAPALIKQAVPEAEHQHFLGEAVQNYLNDDKNAQNLAAAGIEPGSVALERMKSGATERHSELVGIQRNRLIAEAKADPNAPQPGTGQFDIELGKRMEKFIPVPPGGEVWRSSQVPGPNTSGAGPAPGVAPPAGAVTSAGAPPATGVVTGGRGPAGTTPVVGPSVKRPPIPTDAEVDKAAAAKSWVDNATHAANQLESYFQKNPGAGSVGYAARTKLQSMPLIGALPLTTQEEQAITSAVGNLQIDWERAKGGMRMASSPQMQERIRMIFGDPTNAATPQHLRTVAAMLRKEMFERGLLEAKSGRIPLSSPQGDATYRVVDTVTGRPGKVTLKPGEFNLPPNVVIVGE